MLIIYNCPKDNYYAMLRKLIYMTSELVKYGYKYINLIDSIEYEDTLKLLTDCVDIGQFLISKPDLHKQTIQVFFDYTIHHIGFLDDEQFKKAGFIASDFFNTLDKFDGQY